MSNGIIRDFTYFSKLCNLATMVYYRKNAFSLTSLHL
jgi:hypothetical protein